LDLRDPPDRLELAVLKVKPDLPVRPEPPGLPALLDLSDRRGTSAPWDLRVKSDQQVRLALRVPRDHRATLDLQGRPVQREILARRVRPDHKGLKDLRVLRERRARPVPRAPRVWSDHKDLRV